MIKPEITMEYWTRKSWQVYNYFSKYLLFLLSGIIRIDSPTNRKKNTTPTQIIIHFLKEILVLWLKKQDLLMNTSLVHLFLCFALKSTLAI